MAKERRRNCKTETCIAVYILKPLTCLILHFIFTTYLLVISKKTYRLDSKTSHGLVIIIIQLYMITAFNGLFGRIYEQVTVPSQWLVSKTIPVYKNKGDKKDIEKYRPISNLCSSSKIFEKLIIKCLYYSMHDLKSIKF